MMPTGFVTVNVPVDATVNRRSAEWHAKERICAGIGRLAAIPLLAALLLTWHAPPVQAQFNGNFAIERHKLDDENFLDWKAYQFPVTWRFRAYTEPNAFLASVGSISKERFYLFHQIRLEADLGRYMTFLYFQEEESFFRSDELYQEIELRFGRGIYGSAIGWVAADKRENRMGYAVAYGERSDWNFVRFSRLDQFDLFNDRNRSGARDPERFEQIPVLHRLEIRHFWHERLFVQLDLKREDEAVFRELDAEITRTYEGEEVDATVEWWQGQDWMAGFTYSHDLEKRRQEPDSPADTVPDLRQRLYLRWLDVHGGFALGEGDFLTLGYLDGRFENRIRSPFPDADFRSELTTGLGYAVWEHGRNDWASWIFGLYSGVAQELVKEGADSPKEGNEKSLQIKAAVGLVLAEGERYRFFFNSTWDLDILVQRAWDGGNIQIQYFF
ncbi:MAG: hypothetical protein O7D96_07310 [SAR324 cluster bacterium]|nr:hypothetical protein [SAR324 cluster bacterium]